jgi:hypothetical protein
MMDAAGTPETSVYLNGTTRRYILESISIYASSTLTPILVVNVWRCNGGWQYL